MPIIILFFTIYFLFNISTTIWLDNNSRNVTVNTLKGLSLTHTSLPKINNNSQSKKTYYSYGEICSSVGNFRHCIAKQIVMSKKQTHLCKIEFIIQQMESDLK